MDLARGDGPAFKGQVPGGAGVVDDGAGKAKVESGPGGGVDAHVAHGPADYHFFRPGVFKRLQQAGFPEGVGIMLCDDRLSGKRPEALVDFYADGVGPEEHGVWPQGQVLDMENGAPGLAAGEEHFPGLGRGLGHAG